MKLKNERKLLISCARNCICGDKPAGITSLLSPQIKWDDFLDAAISSGMAPLVYKSLKDIPDKTSVPLEVMGSLADIYHGSVARNMYMRSELERILTVFNEKGIEVVLLKGAALSGTVYRDIGLRLMGDIDLLVRPGCLDRAKTLMSELSYAAEGGAGTEEWYRKNHFHLPPFKHESMPIIVEVHWDIAGDSLGNNVNRWWERARKIRVGEATALVPSPEDMVLHLCISLYHGNYDKAALRGLGDIYHTMCYFTGQTDWKLLRDEVSESGIAGPVYSLLSLVSKYFNIENETLSWLVHENTDHKLTVIMENMILDPEDASYSVFMRSLAADTKRGKMRIIINDVFPSREKMLKRYAIRPGSPMVYLCYAFRPIEMALKYGGSFVRMLCFRGAG